MSETTDPIDDFGEAFGALAESVQAAPRRDLRDELLTTAAAAREPGRPVDADDDDIGPAEGFARTVAELDALLGDLALSEWSAMGAGGWTVAQVVGHLIGVERYLGAKLDLWPAEEWDDEHDHRAMTAGDVDAAATLPPADLLERWRAVIGPVVAAVHALDDERLDDHLVFHGFEYRVRSLLVARTFEVWTHSDDIRRALEMAPVDPDASRLRLMTDVAVRALPIGLALSGRVPASGSSARVVLTGPGGGSWIQPLEWLDEPSPGRQLDASSHAVAVTLVADAVAFCRVAAQRLRPADLDVVIEGDRALAEDLLVGVAVFAA